MKLCVHDIQILNQSEPVSLLAATPELSATFFTCFVVIKLKQECSILQSKQKHLFLDYLFWFTDKCFYFETGLTSCQAALNQHLRSNTHF